MDLKRVQGEREGSTGLEQGASASACWGSGTEPGRGERVRNAMHVCWG